MITGRDGLGYWILLAARSFRAADLCAGVILLATLGYGTTAIKGAPENRLLAWQSRAR